MGADGTFGISQRAPQFVATAQLIRLRNNESVGEITRCARMAKQRPIHRERFRRGYPAGLDLFHSAPQEFRGASRSFPRGSIVDTSGVRCEKGLMVSKIPRRCLVRGKTPAWRRQPVSGRPTTNCEIHLAPRMCARSIRCADIVICIFPVAGRIDSGVRRYLLSGRD